MNKIHDEQKNQQWKKNNPKLKNKNFSMIKEYSW